jgi:hypothetical protein
MILLVRCENRKYRTLRENLVSKSWFLCFVFPCCLIKKYRTLRENLVSMLLLSSGSFLDGLRVSVGL